MKSVKIQCVGYELAANWYEGSTENILLVLPGFTSSKKNYEPLVGSLIKKTGRSVLVLDYSGHGESPFNIQDLSIHQNFSEVVVAYDWIKSKYPSSSIDVMGTSYGGYFAARLVKYRELRKIILRVPANYDEKDLYTLWKDLDQEQIRNVYRADPKNFKNHPVLAEGPSFKGSAYVLTHEFDEACPKTSTEPYVAAFKAKTWEAKGFVHGLGKSTYTPEQLDKYIQVLADWILE